MASQEDKSEEQYADALRWVMADASGRAFFHALLDRLGLLGSVFRQPSPLVLPAERLVFNGARRDFAMKLYDDAVRYAPTELDRMQLEARERALMAKAQPKAKGTEEKQDVDEAAS